MDTKVCRDCLARKPASADYFSRSKAQRDGFVNRCKACMSVRWKRHYRDNREHYIACAVEKIRVRRAERPEYDRKLAREAKRRKHSDPAAYAEHLKRSRVWYRANPARVKAFRRNSPEMRRYWAAVRNARKKRATPSWANHEAIKAVYAEAHRMTVETGVPHEVDHIVPLSGRTVCGLHVETNLQVVTRAFNRAKHNCFEDTS